MPRSRDRRSRPALLHHLARFSAVGLVGMMIDVGVFNALRLAPQAVPLLSSPAPAAITSTACAILFNWVGNRYWTFRTERRADVAMEFVQYVTIALLGLLIATGCLLASHYGLRLHSLLADNIAKNGVGLVLGTAVRFLLVRHWLWGRPSASRIAPAVVQPS